MTKKRIVCMLATVAMVFSLAAVISTADSYAAAKHTHKYGAWKVTKKATCTATGKQQRKCKKCDKVQKVTIGKKSHSYDAWKVTKKATCKSQGQKKRVCRVCKKVQTAAIAKTAHSYGAWKTVKAATCNKQGRIERTCTVCGHKDSNITAATGKHVWATVPTVKVSATCSSPGREVTRCLSCGVEKKDSGRAIAKLSHKYGPWKISKAATCGTAGTEIRTCGDCGAVETRAVPATGKHVYGEQQVDVAPTCTSDGSSSRHCKVCGARADFKTIEHTGHNYGDAEKAGSVKIYRSGSQASNVSVYSSDAKGHVLKASCLNHCGEYETLPKEEHDFVAMVISEPRHDKQVQGSYPGQIRYTCQTCGYSYTETIEAPAHKLVVVETTPATCTENGRERSQCEICGQIFSRITEKAYGHQWSEERVTDKKPTCTEDGSESYHCTNEGCTATKDTRVIKARGQHDWNDWQVERKATCTKEGVSVRTCKDCGETERKNTPSLGGHRYEGDPVVIKEATCTEEGLMGRRCVNEGCDSVETTSTIKKKGHQWDEKITVEPTCTEPGSCTRVCDVCGKSESDVEVPARGGAHRWSTVKTVQGGGDSCVPTVGYKVCSDCGEKLYETVDAGSGHDWIETTNSRGSKHMKCSKCGRYQPGWDKLPVADSLKQNPDGPAEYADVAKSYRSGYTVYFTTDMEQSEGFNNHINGIRCASVGEVRIVGGVSGYDDNEFTTVSMTAPAAREGYEFVGWKNAATGQFLKDNPASDGRYRVEGDKVIVNWKASDMTFTPVYKKVEAEPAEVSNDPQIPAVTVPEEEKNEPVDEPADEEEDQEQSEEMIVPESTDEEPAAEPDTEDQQQPEETIAPESTDEGSSAEPEPEE